MKKIFSQVLLLFVLTIFSISLVSCGDCQHENMQQVVTDATCTQAGKVTYKCADCDYSYDDSIVDPLGHKYESTATQPTCESGGYTTYTCSCGQSYTSDHTDATGHDYSKEFYTIPPTCTEQGYTFYSCSKCDNSYASNYVKPTGHKLDKTVTAPTCAAQGYTTYECADCTYSYTAEFVKPTGHDFADEASVTPPSCTEQGYTTYSCTKCDYSYASDYTEPTDHQYTEQEISTANCTEIGITKYTCACGDEYSITVAATGHDFEKTVTMPTLSDMGYTSYVCETCEYDYMGDYRFYSDILPNGAYANNTAVLAEGIDISQHNYSGIEEIDFAGIKAAGIDYVIIRAGSSYRSGYSLGGIDPRFEQSYADAKAAGLDVGVYFYTYATTVDDIVSEAYLLLSILDGKQFEYPIYLDLEDPSLESLSAATLNEMCVEFFTVLQRAGYYTGLYVNNTWLTERIQTDVALSKFEIWYARYPVSATDKVWDVDTYGAHLGMWQYSDSGTFEAVPDIPFDLNFAYKDYPTIIKDGGFNGYGTDIKFVDSDKDFVYITADSLNVRSSPDFDATDNLIGTATKGSRFEIIEKADTYTKIKYKGLEAYISANSLYVSFEMPTP